MRAGVCGTNETRAVGGHSFQLRTARFTVLESILSRFTVLEEVQIDVRPGRYSEDVCPVPKVGPVARIVV